MDFHTINECNSSTLTTTCLISLPIPRRLANKRSDSQSTYLSHKIHSSKGTKSGFHTKSREVRFDTNTAIHIYRYGISNSAGNSQSTSGLSKSSYSDHQNNSLSDSSFSTNFPFSFGQTQCSSRFNSSRQIAFMTSANVPVIGLETSHSSISSSSYDQQYDQIPFEMVNEHQSLRSRSAHSKSRPQNIPLYGCQSLQLGSSSGTDESILSWSLVGGPIPTPYQHVGNNGHSFRIDKSLEIYSPFLCHDIYRQHNSGLIYQQARRNTFSQPMRGSMENPPMMPKTSYCSQDSTYPRQIQCFGRQVIENRQNNQNRMGIGSVDGEFNFPDVQLSESGSVCDMFQSQTSTICIPSSGQSSFCDRQILHELEQSSCLCISSNNADFSCPEQDTSVSVQNSSYSPSLAATSMILRGTTSACLSSSSSSTFSKTINTSKRKVSTSKPPSSQPSRLGVIKQSVRDRKFSQNIADFVSKSRRTSAQKVYDMKWTVYTRWFHRKKVNPVSAPLAVIAVFL